MVSPCHASWLWRQPIVSAVRRQHSRGGAPRRRIRSVYARVDVEGPRFVAAHLTPDARELGLTVALPEEFVMASPAGVAIVGIAGLMLASSLLALPFSETRPDDASERTVEVSPP